jgi:hypothetical protein
MQLSTRIILGILVLASIWTARSGWAQSELPIVVVEVDIETSLYRDELGAFIDEIESTLQESAVERLESFDVLRFVHWATPGAQTDHALRIVIESVSGGLGEEIRMRFFRRVDGLENDLADQNLEYFNPTVFGGFDQKFAQDPDRLASELSSWLRSHINESFVVALQDKFLRDITLETRVLLDEVGRRLIVPIRFSALNPRKESKLRVEFVSNQIGDPREGTINLNMTGKSPIPNSAEDGLDCEISVFKYPTISTSSAESALNRWEEIKTVLADDHLVELLLYMEEYIPSFFPNTTGRLATDGPPL